MRFRGRDVQRIQAAPVLWPGSRVKLEEMMHRIKSYFEALELLAELIGLHPRRTDDQDFMDMLRKAGWRPFDCSYRRG